MLYKPILCQKYLYDKNVSREQTMTKKYIVDKTREYIFIFHDNLQNST